MFVEVNNWFISALVQANAALIAIISGFVINIVLNEHENIHALDAELSVIFYKVRYLLASLPKPKPVFDVSIITLEQARPVGSSRSFLTNWQVDAVENYNTLIELYMKENSKRERLDVIRRWMRYVRVLILVLVIIPAFFIFPEGVKTIRIIFKPEVVMRSFFSQKTLALAVTYFMIMRGLGFINSALTKVIDANKSRVRKIRNVFDKFCNEQPVNSLLNSMINEGDHSLVATPRGPSSSAKNT